MKKQHLSYSNSTKSKASPLLSSKSDSPEKTPGYNVSQKDGFGCKNESNVMIGKTKKSRFVFVTDDDRIKETDNNSQTKLPSIIYNNSKVRNSDGGIPRYGNITENGRDASTKRDSSNNNSGYCRQDLIKLYNKIIDSEKYKDYNEGIETNCDDNFDNDNDNNDDDHDDLISPLSSGPNLKHKFKFQLSYDKQPPWKKNNHSVENASKKRIKLHKLLHSTSTNTFKDYNPSSMHSPGGMNSLTGMNSPTGCCYPTSIMTYNSLSGNTPFKSIAFSSFNNTNTTNTNFSFKPKSRKVKPEEISNILLHSPMTSPKQARLNVLNRQNTMVLGGAGGSGDNGDMSDTDLLLKEASPEYFKYNKNHILGQAFLIHDPCVNEKKEKHYRKDMTPILVKVGMHSHIIQPAFMQKTGSMCFTELWSDRKKSKFYHQMNKKLGKIVRVEENLKSTEGQIDNGIFRPDKISRVSQIFGSLKDLSTSKFNGKMKNSMIYNPEGDYKNIKNYLDEKQQHHESTLNNKKPDMHNTNANLPMKTSYHSTLNSLTLDSSKYLFNGFNKPEEKKPGCRSSMKKMSWALNSPVNKRSILLNNRNHYNSNMHGSRIFEENHDDSMRKSTIISPHLIPQPQDFDTIMLTMSPPRHKLDKTENFNATASLKSLEEEVFLPDVQQSQHSQQPKALNSSLSTFDMVKSTIFNPMTVASMPNIHSEASPESLKKKSTFSRFNSISTKTDYAPQVDTIINTSHHYNENYKDNEIKLNINCFIEYDTSFETEEGKENISLMSVKQANGNKDINRISSCNIPIKEDKQVQNTGLKTAHTTITTNTNTKDTSNGNKHDDKFSEQKKLIELQEARYSLHDKVKLYFQTKFK